MNKLVFSLFLLFAFAAAPSSADIGDNFMQGGIGLSGSVSMSGNLFYFADPSEQRKSWSLSVSPDIDYYVADRLSLQLSPWFYFESFTADPENIDRSETYGMSVGVDYALFMEPSAQRGFVVTVSGLIGLSFYPVIDDVVAGVETPNNYKRTDVSLTIMPRFSYFLNERTAVSIKIVPTVSYTLAYADPDGTVVQFTPQERVHADVTVTVGVTRYYPNNAAAVLLTD
jgi:hypothetical protein